MPLTDVTATELETASDLDQRARDALTAAQQELRTAEAEHSAAQGALTQRALEQRELRRRLAAAADDMPADAAGLADDVELSIVRLRAQAIAVNRAQRRLADARRRFSAAGARVRDSAAAKAAAQAAKHAADERQQRLTAAQAALHADPLSAVQAAATTALADRPLTDADDRLAADIPAALLARARARLQIARAEVADSVAIAADAATKTATARVARDGQPAVTAQARAAMDAAERAYLATLDGRSDLDRALAAITAVNATPAISEDRKDRIAALTSQLTSDTVDLESDRDDKLDAVRRTRRAYQQQWHAALAADPDADPASNTDVQSAKTDLDRAQQDRRRAEEALDAPAAPGEPTPRELFGRWEAAIPDQTWTALVALETARATLQRLYDTAPSTLRTTLGDAEEAYATALDSEARGARGAAALAALAADRAGAATVAARTTSQLSAVRGDT